MKYLKFSCLFLLALILSACASSGARYGNVERITTEEMAKILPPAVATFSLDEIVTDSKQGKTADEIIAKIQTSNSRYELTPSQSLELSRKGVDVKVLDYIHQSNEAAKQNAVAEEINKREKAKRIAQDRLEQEREFMRDGYYDPFWGPRFGGFYGPYGYPYYGNPYLAPRWGWGFNYYRRH
ncbi:MAG: hypothetical protein ACKVOA_09695 [Methylophilaceae bacterium]